MFSGFCGSVTTFSTWQYEVWSAWVNADNNRRGRLRNVSDVTVFPNFFNSQQGSRWHRFDRLYILNIHGGAAVRPLHNVTPAYDLSITQIYASTSAYRPTHVGNPVGVDIRGGLSCIFFNVSSVSKSGDRCASLLLSRSTHTISSRNLAEPSLKSLSTRNIYGQRSWHRTNRNLPRLTKQVDRSTLPQRLHYYGRAH